MVITNIASKVNELRKKYSLNTIPVDLNKVTSKENFDVIEMDFSEFENKVNRQISGILYISGETKQILVNMRDNDRRRNFTVAHELGHYYLHYDKNKEDEVFVSFRGDSNPREAEANRFAAELLIPSEKLRKEHELTLFPTISDFASKFNVSIQAMRIKLNQMGLSIIEL